MAVEIAERVKRLRLDRGWTQEEAAKRAGMALATFRLFERTGRISLERLLKLAVVLDARDGFNGLFAAPAARSLEELERSLAPSTRKRGKRSHAQT